MKTLKSALLLIAGFIGFVLVLIFLALELLAAKQYVDGISRMQSLNWSFT